MTSCVYGLAPLYCRTSTRRDCCGLMSGARWLTRSASLNAETAGFRVCMRAVTVSLRAYWVTFDGDAMKSAANNGFSEVSDPPDALALRW